MSMSYWALVLCDMRASRIEEGDSIVAWAETPEALRELLERERVEGGYREDRWGKTFRKGGPLEWCNESNSLRWMGSLPRGSSEDGLIVPIPSPDEAAEAARAGQAEFLDRLYKVT